MLQDNALLVKLFWISEITIAVALSPDFAMYNFFFLLNQVDAKTDIFFNKGRAISGNGGAPAQSHGKKEIYGKVLRSGRNLCRIVSI